MIFLGFIFSFFIFIQKCHFKIGLENRPVFSEESLEGMSKLSREGFFREGIFTVQPLN